MGPNGNILKEKLEVLRIRVERIQQGRARNQIELDWSDKSKEN